MEIQFGLIHDCIRACVFTNYLRTHAVKSDAWFSIRDICYADAIMSWNAIFGVRSQETHWQRFEKKISIPEEWLLKPFSKSMIVEALQITEKTWDRYHATMVEMRNHRIAHINRDAQLSEPPNITLAMRSAYLYREWLLRWLRAEQAAGRTIKITETTGPEMLAMFEAQIAEICQR